jgi:hypothetical protein
MNAERMERLQRFKKVLQGQIRNKDARRTILDYSGMCYNGWTPGDVDGCFQPEPGLTIHFEFKESGAPLSDGQKFKLEEESKKLTYEAKIRHDEKDNSSYICFRRVGEVDDGLGVVIVADHNVRPGSEEQVSTASCSVRCYFLYGRWETPEEQTTVRQLFDTVVEYWKNRPRHTEKTIMENLIRYWKEKNT